MTDWATLEAAVGVAFLLGLALGALAALGAVAMVSTADSALDRAAGAVEALAAQVRALRDTVEVQAGALRTFLEQERQDRLNDEARRHR